MSQNRHAYAVLGQHPVASHDDSAAHTAAQHQHQQHQHQQQNPPNPPNPQNQHQHQRKALRASASQSTLADSIRALREHASSSKLTPLSSPTSPAESLSNRRKAPAPSTLQQLSTSASSKLYLREGLHSPLSPNSLLSYSLPPRHEVPSSPRDRLDALLSPLSGSPQGAAQTSLTKGSESVRQPKSYGQLRNVSAPLSPTVGRSPPTSPFPSLPTLPQQQTVMPRNSSIDSTVSSISSNTSQPPRQNPPSGFKPIQENGVAFDATSLVAQAGSAEAALHALWKEKQSATSHNGQLWRLVEKQRSMILGLNKDLERALKEKERYRKKLKDHSVGPQAQLLSTAPTAAAANVLSGLPTSSALGRELRDISQSPASTERRREQLHSTQSTRTAGSLASLNNSQEVPAERPAQVVAPAPSEVRAAQVLDLSALRQEGQGIFQNSRSIFVRKTPSAAIEPVLLKSRQSPNVASDITSLTDSASGHTSIEASPITSPSPRESHSEERSQTPLTDPIHLADSSPVHKETQQRSVEHSSLAAPSIVGSFSSPPPLTPPPTLPSAAPKLAITNPTPVIDSGSFPSPPRQSMASRKAAPARLNLTQSNLSPTQEQHAVNRQSPVVAIRGPAVNPDNLERGRRRTREEDDRVREEIAVREEEARSKSTKKAKSKSGGTTPVSSPTILIHQEPAIANFISRAAPPSPQLGLYPSTLLSPIGSEGSFSSTTVQRNSISAPLLSPGLPMSPRPGHRPANSPAPRHPKSNTSVSSDPSTPGSAPSAPSESATNSSPLSSTPAHSSHDSPAQPLVSEASYPSPSAVPPPLFAARSFESPAYKQTIVPQPPVRAAPPRPTVDTEHLSPASDNPSITLTESPSDRIYRGFVSDQYPSLLLPPNALPLVDVKVYSSRLRPSRNSILLAKDEDPVFLLGIHRRADGVQLWRLEKTSAALPALHHQVQMLCPFEGKLPDHNLFQGHAPAKIDARRAALNEYFDLLLESPLTERAALAMCAFFSADAIGPDLEEQDVGTSAKKSSIAATVRPNSRSHREGYLTKRGKNFGGWKARYFILDGPELRYYDSQGGPQIGVIKLYSAQIGKQSAHASNESPVRDADENQYRHAFLILEPKRKDSSSLVRHVLCAESDEERDAWVRACMAYVDYQEEKPRSSTSSKQLSGSSPASTLSRLTSTPPHSTPVVSHQPDRLRDERSLEVEPPTSSHNSNKENEPVGTKSMSTVARRRNESPQAESAQTLGVSYEETVQAEAPIIGPTSYHNRGLPSPNLTGSFPRGHPLHSAAISGKEFSISAPMDGGRIQDAAMWGMKTPTPAKEKKRSIFGFRGRSSSDLNIHPAGATFSSEGTERREPPRNVFGMPLLEAIECSQPLGVDDYLPAVVYRSLEYLRARDAVIEEGIFRLSGSNTTIKALRERFNTEGDVKLLEEEYYDVHAVASLLKLYLRELPTSILTRDRHLDFLKVLELDDKPKKIASFNVLVHQLPAANYALLQALCAFLIEVINNSDLNKMNVRNVGIVFAPTLNIPGPLISMFLTDFEAIFGLAIDEEKSPIREVTLSVQPPSDGIRSPRHQLFSELPTPAANQTSFQSMGGFQPLAHQGAAHRISTMQQSRAAQPSHDFNVPQQRQSHHQTQAQLYQQQQYQLQQQQYQQAEQYQQYRAYQQPVYNMQLAGSDSNFGSLDALTSQPTSQQRSGSLDTGDSKRGRRESAMMGMQIGLVGQRQTSRQTLRDTSSSRVPPSAQPTYS